MIDYGGGFMAGIKIGFIFVLLGIEAYFLILGKAMDRELSRPALAILATVFILSLIAGARWAALLSVLPVPAAYVILRLIEQKTDERLDRRHEDKEERNLRLTILRYPDNSKAHLALGDIYYRRDDFENAVDCYRKAYTLTEQPWIAQKIKVADRENRIKKGEIWLCPECGVENPGAATECARCGYILAVLDAIRADLKKQKKEIKRELVIFIAASLLIALLLLLIHQLALYFAIVIFLAVMYLILRKFLTW